MAEDWPLPPGWEASFDNTTQKWYFINHNEKVTTWEDPRPAYYSSKGKGTESTNTGRTSSLSHNGEKKADDMNAYDFPELECDSPFAGDVSRPHKSEVTRRSEDEAQAAKSEKIRLSARSSHLSSDRKPPSSSKQSDLSPNGKSSPTAKEINDPPSCSLSMAPEQGTKVPGVLMKPGNSLKMFLTPMVKLPEFEEKINSGWKIIEQIESEFSRCTRIKAQGPNPALLGTRVQACGPNPSLACGPNSALVRGPAKLVKS
ncbi:unnamed protein product [Calicophoron daubneyi]|uniref:WW domain-containing protein n=1 Tax=Calicophoron daubneyi TaxID=300641 RepID=A0AAV2TKT7_CALDB